MSLSEVARLRKQIELECEALKLYMTGYAVTASHDIINHKYLCMDRSVEQLEQIVGVEQAANIATEVYQEVLG